MICPTCKRAFTTPAESSTPGSPFCSPRCRTADLGNWLSGNYRIVTDTSDEELDSGLDTEGDNVN